MTENGNKVAVGFVKVFKNTDVENFRGAMFFIIKTENLYLIVNVTLKNVDGENVKNDILQDIYVGLLFVIKIENLLFSLGCVFGHRVQEGLLMALIVIVFFVTKIEIFYIVNIKIYTETDVIKINVAENFVLFMAKIGNIYIF